MAIFMCEAQGDVVYLKASSEQAANMLLVQHFGEIPASLLTWTEVEALPEGAELIK